MIGGGAGLERQRHVYSVSELNLKIKALLENNFPFIWICGEISNLRIPSSGHAYFTLKDPGSQLQGVMFRNQLKGLKFRLEEGQQIIGFGRVGLYEIRGSYQIILEHLEPSGIGALQAAFLQLKARLEAEGLFDAARKRPLPFLPRCIGVVTSPSGAVIRDMLQVIARRFPAMAVQLVPVQVQGEAAAAQIVTAIETLNRRMQVDVLVLARGGGAIEDLQPFNDERVARALHASRIPTVSAVGHETDFTIADFVADLRAPTPSAAAELVVPLSSELLQRCQDRRAALIAAATRLLGRARLQLDGATRRLVHPRRRLQDLSLRIDDLEGRLRRALRFDLERRRARLFRCRLRLLAGSPARPLERINVKIEENINKLINLMSINIIKHKGALAHAMARLQALSPLSVLERGYCIARTVPLGRVVRDPCEVSGDQLLALRFRSGELQVRVLATKTGGAS
jgi:exodeoxyribonuclease VII large subunit